MDEVKHKPNWNLKEKENGWVQRQVDCQVLRVSLNGEVGWKIGLKLEYVRGSILSKLNDKLKLLKPNFSGVSLNYVKLLTTW